MQPDQKDGKKKWIAVILVAVVIVGFGIYYFLGSQPAKEPVPVEQPSKSESSDMTAKPSPESVQAPLPAGRVALAESDDWVRKKSQEISPHAGWTEWLMNKNLVRRLTAAVVNITEGKSPRKHLNFLGPQKPFSALKKDEKLYLDPQSYDRYNLVAEVFSNLDASRAVGLFKEFNPLFQEAYRELGYPQGDFQGALIQAMKELLAVPVVEGGIQLKETVLSYWAVDDNLEDLSEAQKHLLRMGPQNTRKIQKKLREMVLLLGVPENQIPASKVYSAKNE